MKRAFIGTILAISALIGATGIGLGIIHATDFPYTADIGYLNISESSGLGRDEIMANYNAVTSYLTPFSNREFHLPTLNYSEMGAGHFADCKAIFTGFYIAAIIAIIIIAAFFALRWTDRKTLKYSGIITLAIPLAFALGLAIDFENMFILFHALLFEGETWMFDPRLDEIIKILPAEFFMHCALFIAFFWIGAGVLQIAAGAKRSKSL